MRKLWLRRRSGLPLSNRLVKLDESTDYRIRSLLESAGFQVDTVDDQRLKGRADEDLLEVVGAHAGILVTQDLDLADLRRYRHQTDMVVVVLRTGTYSSWLAERLLRDLLEQVALATVRGRLIVVAPGRIRIHPIPVEDASR